MWEWSTPRGRPRLTRWAQPFVPVPAAANGPHPPDGTIACFLFVRALGLVFLTAFASLWPQLLGLWGSRGILPAAPYLQAVSDQVGPERYRLLPTLFWLGAGDGALHAVCALGLGCSLLLLIGSLEWLALWGAWGCYLSLVGIGRDFMGFQWDSLLLESAACALPLLGPRLRLRPRAPGPDSDGPPPAARILLFALLLRFMFAAGWAKLRSGDPTWRHLTALDYHFFTQPLPSPLAYYAHQLPSAIKQGATFIMFVIECAVPFGLFFRRARGYAAALLIGLQVAIAATGNYGFFNLLSAALAIPLLPDQWIVRLVPKRLRDRGGTPETCTAAVHTADRDPDSGFDTSEKKESDTFQKKESPAPVESVQTKENGIPRALPSRGLITAGLRGFWILLLGYLGAIQGVLLFVDEDRLPAVAARPLEWSAPLHLANHYGLFAVMTQERPEILIEGSQDGVQWTPYPFKYKPVDLDARPRWNAPHQPRLDWQMWFAALRSRRRGGWFDGLCIRLLQGSPDVLWLLAYDPFFGRRPKYVRATLYQYEFTTWAEHKATGAYYKRRDPKPYLSPVSLP